MASFQINSEPGQTSLLESVEANIFWGNQPVVQNLQGFASLYSGAVDSTNTPTTLLRPGLVLGKVTSTGQLTNYSPTATDGSQLAVAILGREVNMLDWYTAAVANRALTVILTGPVRASALIGLDNISRKQLRAQGFIFDDDRTVGYNVPFLKVVAKAADYTVTAADNGTLFTATTGAVNFTLPTLAAGLAFSFYNLVDAAMTITSAAGDDIVTDGDLSADSVAFSTASHKIGGGVLVVANADATKWLTFFQGAAPANVVTVAT